MANVRTSLEGKIIIIKYTVSDYNSKREARFVYKVIEGKVEHILWILDLPDKSYLSNADEEALKVIKSQSVTEVYCPQ